MPAPADPLSCAHHPACPGCPLMGRPYAEQLRLKRDRLQRALDKFPHLGLRAPAVLPAARAAAYRHRLKLPVEIRDRAARVGLTDPTTGRVVDTPTCPVLADPLREGLAAIRAWMAGKHGIHSLDLRVNSAGELQAVLACVDGRLPGGDRAAAKLTEQLPALRSLAVSTADPERRRVKGDQPRVIAGRPWIGEQVGDTRYRLHPGAFFQVDPAGAAQIHAAVRDLARDKQGRVPATILDLYGGVGAYAAMLSQQPGAESVWLVEEDPAACQGARAVAPPNMRVWEGRAEDSLAHLPAANLAILNPARRGADRRLLLQLARKADALLYVSCSPESLARDLDVLASAGMRASEIRAIDLFPQTPEVETVVRLEAAPPLARWSVPGGEASGVDKDGTSGALGTPTEILALLIGDTGPNGQHGGASWERASRPAGHSLLRIRLSGDRQLSPLLRSLRDRGHPIAWEDPKTRAFFENKALLQRPFLHVLAAGRARAPLHGDLQIALDLLR